MAVFNIDINEPKLLINDVTLNMEVRLRGLRRIVYEWFYTVSLIVISSSASMIYLVLEKGFKLSKFMEIKMIRYIKKVAGYDENGN